MARIAKPVELKKRDGTYRKDRDAKREGVEKFFSSAALPEGASIPCPDSITAEYCRAYWAEITGYLLGFGVLSAVDLPQIETLCLTLEKLREAEAAFKAAEPLTENYERLLAAVSKLSKRFDELGAKYYISPAARSRLALDALNVAKTAQEVRAGESAIGSLLAGR